MTIEYQETSRDLQTRIDIHSRYGSRNIDTWMLDLLRPEKGTAILDVACGGGKQCRAFFEYGKGELEIVGGDVSQELLAEARRVSQSLGDAFRVQELDFNQRFPFEDGGFDLATCCFAIYYAQDIPFTLRELHRVLRPNGRLFTTGPMPENKRLFYDIIREATGRTIPPMPGSSRYGSQILDEMKGLFRKVEVHIFENPLEFREVQPFLDYTRASLSEDRKLWAGLFHGAEEFEAIMHSIEAVARGTLERTGSMTMTKVVGGFLASK